jgi:alpha-L-fucosidase
MKDVGVDYLSYRDRSIPAVPQWRDWETCMTLNDSWGYTKNTNWKSPAVLIGQLVEIASTGGKLYVHLFKWPQGKFGLSGVTGKVTKAYLLSDRGNALPVTQADGKLTVQMPTAAPAPIATVLCLEHNRIPHDRWTGLP